MDTVIVFTAKNKERTFEQGGSGNWKLNSERVKKCQYVILTANSFHANSSHPKDEHGSAFMIGRISNVVAEAYDDLGRKEGDRWVIQFSEYAELNIPGLWGGHQNPVKYANIAELGIHPETLDWTPFPTDRILPVDQHSVPALTIEEAKNGIAKKLGIQPENIEIIIRA